MRLVLDSNSDQRIFFSRIHMSQINNAFQNVKEFWHIIQLAVSEF